jgi:hypothetical protein
MLRAGLLGVYFPLLPLEVTVLAIKTMAAFIIATIAFMRVKA